LDLQSLQAVFDGINDRKNLPINPVVVYNQTSGVVSLQSSLYTMNEDEIVLGGDVTTNQSHPGCDLESYEIDVTQSSIDDWVEYLSIFLPEEDCSGDYLRD